MLITSIANPKVKNWIKLKTKKYRDKTNTFLVEGMHLVLEAYKQGYIKEVIVEQNELFPLDVPVIYVSNDILSKISTLETPPTVMAICERQSSPLDFKDRILVLDNLQDPGNLGTIIRSAVAFNIDTLVLSDDTVDLYNPKVIRASQGMIFHLNIIRAPLQSFLESLKQDGYHIYGTKVTYGKDVRKLNKAHRYALVMGNEGSGLSETVGDLCDEYLYIKMNDTCESLNVSIATSILLYELDQ